MYYEINHNKKKRECKRENDENEMNERENEQNEQGRESTRIFHTLLCVCNFKQMHRKIRRNSKQRKFNGISLSYAIVFGLLRNWRGTKAKGGGRRTIGRVIVHVEQSTAVCSVSWVGKKATACEIRSAG